MGRDLLFRKIPTFGVGLGWVGTKGLGPGLDNTMNAMINDGVNNEKFSMETFH